MDVKCGPMRVPPSVRGTRSLGVRLGCIEFEGHVKVFGSRSCSLSIEISLCCDAACYPLGGVGGLVNVQGTQCLPAEDGTVTSLISGLKVVVYIYRTFHQESKPSKQDVNSNLSGAQKHTTVWL